MNVPLTKLFPLLLVGQADGQLLPHAAVVVVAVRLQADDAAADADGNPKEGVEFAGEQELEETKRQI